jgi:hypothetical protein
MLRQHRTLILLVLLLVAVVAWMLVEVQRVEPPAEAGSAAPAPASAALPPPVFAAARVSRPSAAAQEPTCGPADKADERAIAQAQRQALERVWPAWLRSDDAQVRAAAQALLGTLDGAPPDALLRSAASTTDPVIYALAMRACLRDERASPACGPLSAAQWARLEPDNAMPWFALAARARSQRDVDAEAEAMHRASLAKTSDPHLNLLSSILLPALRPDLPAQERTLVMLAVTSADASVLPVYAGAPEGYCEPARLDANRRQTCEAIATLLVEKGLTALDRGIGISTGRKLGWPADKLDALKLEGAVLSDVAARWLMPGESSIDPSCAAYERRLGYAIDTGRRGELAVWREIAQRSGKSMRQLTDEHLARQRPLVN